MTIDSQEMPNRGTEDDAGRAPRRVSTARTVTALVLLAGLGAGGLVACAPSSGSAGSEDLPDGWEQHTASGVSFALPSDWTYHELLSWPGAWTPDGDGDTGKGPSIAVHSEDLMGGDYGTGAPGHQIDVPGADGAEYWHHDIPPEGGDLHEIVITVSDWVGVRVALTAGDLSDAEARALFENVAGSLRVDGEVEDDYEAAQRFGSFTDLKPTGEEAELPDLSDLPTGIPDGWGFAGPQGFRIRLPDGWIGDPGTEEAAWIHPGTGARIRVDEADSYDTWEPTRGTPFAMPGADIAVASASVVTDQTGQELVEVQVDVRRDGGRGYTAFVDAPAADLADLLIPFLGSLKFQPEAGGTGWVKDLPEYPHLADPPASWAEAEVGFLQLAVPEGLEEEGEGYWATGTGQDDADLAVTPMDAPIEKQQPGQTAVPVPGATSVLVVIVKDHDMGPDFFVGVAEIVLESGEVYSVAYHAPGVGASEKTFGQILGSLAVRSGS